MKRIIECVPNFSEGRDMEVIRQITDVIVSVPGVRLLNVDPGAATNRTVVTFVGEPEPVVEAAFLAVKKASQIIDMHKHSGEHPRMGSTDVCPLIPVAGITMDETVEYARSLAKRIGEELQIPVYCYESAAFAPERKNLANCRSGEYEGLNEKLSNPEWAPDFGPATFNAVTGATAVGARDFLVAFNVNLNTTSTRRANSIAFDVRERGRPLREGDPITGKTVKDGKGNTVYVPGTLKSVKAIGWYIEEYGIAQISMNLTNIGVTPVHIAFEEVVRMADARGVRVTGSELVGLIPLKSMLDAGRYFLYKQRRSLGVSEKELIKIAVKSMGLDELKPFRAEEKIIEYMIRDDGDKKLIGMNLAEFSNETASESPAPGGGSISAYVGALGVSLATMVANLSSHKRGWDDRWEEFSEVAVKGQKLKDELLALVDEDTLAFNLIMNAFALPKETIEEKTARKNAIQEATIHAIEVPFKVMQLALASMDVIGEMAVKGNPNSVSDAGVGAMCARTAVLGAFLNVRINASGCDNKAYVQKRIQEGNEIQSAAIRKEAEILEVVLEKISA